jgi:hypothetical protein
LTSLVNVTSPSVDTPNNDEVEESLANHGEASDQGIGFNSIKFPFENILLAQSFQYYVL